MKLRLAIACTAAVVATLVGAGTAAAIKVGSGTFATPLGPVEWRWKVWTKPWVEGEVKVYQRMDLTAPFSSRKREELDARIPIRHGRLSFQTRRTAAPVVVWQAYPYDTQALVAWPSNLAGIVTLGNVRALKLHYVYTDTQPVSPGTTDLIVEQPTSRHRLRNTRLKFWSAGANGGGNGFVYDLQTVHGKVRICNDRNECRWYWKLIYKWPPWSKIAPLGQLTPYQ